MSYEQTPMKVFNALFDSNINISHFRQFCTVSTLCSCSLGFAQYFESAESLQWPFHWKPVSEVELHRTDLYYIPGPRIGKKPFLF